MDGVRVDVGVLEGVRVGVGVPVVETDAEDDAVADRLEVGVWDGVRVWVCVLVGVGVEDAVWDGDAVDEPV